MWLAGFSIWDFLKVLFFPLRARKNTVKLNRKAHRQVKKALKEVKNGEYLKIGSFYFPVNKLDKGEHLH